jgi:hypothetical protein
MAATDVSRRKIRMLLATAPLWLSVESARSLNGMQC